MTEAFPLLSLLIWLPIFGGVMVWVVGDGQVAAAKRLALGFTVAALAVAMPQTPNPKPQTPNPKPQTPFSEKGL